MSSVMKRLEDWSDKERSTLLDEIAERAWPKAHSAKPKARSFFARIRYVGQGHELDVPIVPRQARDALQLAFSTLHSQRYAFTLALPVEVVSVRHVAEGAGREPKFERDARPTARRLDGPVSVALSDATLFVEKGWHARLVDLGAWLLERK
jgi:N-methylhydantoinase A